MSDKMTDLWLLGAGGHAKVAQAVAEAAKLRVTGVYDDDPRRGGTAFFDLLVGSPIPKEPLPGNAHLAIGSNIVRKRLADARMKWSWRTLIHPVAWMDPTSAVGTGSLVCAGACIQVAAQVGSHVIVNTAAVVEHDCVVGDFCHIAPGAALAGSVVLGEGVLVGVGAVILPGLRIGDWAVIGAGAVVTRDVTDGVTMVGVPARALQ